MCIIYKHLEISTGRTARARLGQRVTHVIPIGAANCLHQGCAVYVPVRSTVQIFPTSMIKLSCFRIFQIEQKVLVLQSFNWHFSGFVGRLHVFLDLEMAVQFLCEWSAPATGLFPTSLRSIVRLTGRHAFYRQIFICVLIFYFTIFFNQVKFFWIESNLFIYFMVLNFKSQIRISYSSGL